MEVTRKKWEALNKLGIYNMDIREGNYLGGRLFDFSVAVAFPHISLWPRLWSVEQILNEKETDLGCFDAMVERVRKEKSERGLLIINGEAADPAGDQVTKNQSRSTHRIANLAVGQDTRKKSAIPYFSDFA